jgi:hypothetical protein
MKGDVDTSTCRVCGADLTEKSAKWVVVTPAGAFCESHVKTVA